MSAAVNVLPPASPKNCLFMPWTRQDYLYDVLHCIDALVLARSDFEIVFYVDTDEKALYDKLHSWAILQTQQGWNGITLVRSGNPPPSESAVLDRRARIVHMKEDSKNYINASDYVFGLEDDTIFPPHSFTRLKDIFDKHQGCGYAEGVEMGRWGLSVIGAWVVDDLYEPTTMGTINMPEQPEIVSIDGGGFFCYLTPVELYMDHKYYWAEECFGPDATYGIELRKKGYDCYMDSSLVCDHLTPQGRLVPYPRNVVAVQWEKHGSRWVRDDSGDYKLTEVS